MAKDIEATLRKLRNLPLISSSVESGIASFVREIPIFDLNDPERVRTSVKHGYEILSQLNNDGRINLDPKTGALTITTRIM